jgi:hypothetical protein
MQMSGCLSAMANCPEAAAARALIEQTFAALKALANQKLAEGGLLEEDRFRLLDATRELATREMWMMRAQQGDQEAIRVLRMMRERHMPLDQYPDPGQPFIEELIENPFVREQMGLAQLQGQQQLALESGPLAIEAPASGPEVASGSAGPEVASGSGPALATRGVRYRITEEERAELMNEMARNERDPDPDRETSYLNNSDYRMDNGLILRYHEGPNTMWIELRTPPRVGEMQGSSLGTIATLKNVRDGDKLAEISQRTRIYQLAKRLQPSSMKALAAIRDTVALEAMQQAPTPMTPPMTPRPGAPMTPYPYPMSAAPGTPGLALGAMSKAAAKPKPKPKPKP